MAGEKDADEEVPLRTFFEWFERKLANKYALGLLKLQKRFTSVISLLRSMLCCAVDLGQLIESYIEFASGQSSKERFVTDYHGLKQFVDNIIHLVNGLAMDFPICLDLEFVEVFFTSIQDKLELLYANIHPIAHFESHNAELKKHLQQAHKRLLWALQMLPSCMADVHRAAQLSMPLLRKLEVAKAFFRKPWQQLVADVQSLQSNEHLQLSPHFNAEDDKQFGSSGVSLLGRLQRLKSECGEIQILLEMILEPLIRISHELKNKRRRLSKTHLKPDQLANVVQYVNCLVKPDFLSHLGSIQINELCQAMSTLLQQPHLQEEIQRQSLLLSLSEPEDAVAFFKSTYTEWKHDCTVIQELEKSSAYDAELQRIKDAMPLSDANFAAVRRNYERSLKDHQRLMGFYHRVMAAFHLFKVQVASFCLKEFDIIAEVTLPEFNHESFKGSSTVDHSD